MPSSAADVVSPAFEHTIQQLFKPFRLGQWTRLGITGLLAGELGSAGGCSFQIPSIPQSGNSSENFLAQGLPSVNAVALAAIVLTIVLGAILLVALIYVNSMMRFVLFDSVIAKECHIRRYWAQRREPGFRYFVWQLLFTLVVLGGVTVFVSTAAIIGFGLGWFRNPGQYILPLILSGIVFFLAFAAFLILAFTVSVLTKDFVVPQMAAEDISAVDGWRRLLSMLKAEKAGYAGYVGLKILLSIAAAIVLGIAALVVIIVCLIPMGLAGLIAVLAANAAGLAWNFFTITLAIIAGCIVAAIILCGIFLAAVPMVVFFPAYSIHFFEARYPPLGTMINSQ